MFRVARLGRTSLALAALCLALAAPSAVAQAPNLTGETLESNPGVVPGDQTTFSSATCNKDGTTTFEFQASGTATGPYNGTFTETGTVTIGPQTDLGGVGRVIDFSASFTIDSAIPPGTITGTKTLAPGAGADPASGFARCDSDGDPVADDVFANVTNFFVLYEAQIDTTAGSRTDSGNAGFVLRSMPAFPATDTFLEIFNSTEPVPPPLCDEDDQGDDDDQGGDDQGCEDEDDQGEDG